METSTYFATQVQSYLGFFLLLKWKERLLLPLWENEERVINQVAFH